MIQTGSLSGKLIVLSKYHSSEKGISVVFHNVKNMESSWILHDLDLIMINCTIGNSKFYLAKHSAINIGVIDIKNSKFGKLKVIDGYEVYVRSSKIQYIEAHNSHLHIAEIMFSAESVLKTNNCSLRINGKIKQETVAMNSGKIVLRNLSHLLVTNATFENLVHPIWINTEDSNVTLQNSVISNMQMISRESKLGSALTINNCTFRIKYPFSTSSKCAVCLNGIKNNTIFKSKFVLDQNYGHRSLFNISNGSYINVFNSQFDTETLTQFHISKGQYHILTKRSTFKKGNLMLLSEQPHFMKHAAAAGNIETYSADISHNELDKSAENEHSGKGTYFMTNLVPLLSCVFVSTVCMGLCIFCKRKTKQRKRMKEHDAFLCYSQHDLNIARTTSEEMEKNKLKLIFPTRDFVVGAAVNKNIRNAVESSNCAIVILSKKFLESTWCQTELQQCLIEHQTDPSFQVFVILTEKKRQLKTHLKKSLPHSSDNREYVRFFFSKERCLDFNDPKLHEKLFKKIRKNQPKTRKVKQQSIGEISILLKDEFVEEIDDSSYHEYQSRPDPGISSGSYISSIPSDTDEFIDQGSRISFEYTDIDVRSLCEHKQISSSEYQNGYSDRGRSESSEKTNSNESRTLKNDEMYRCRGR